MTLHPQHRCVFHRHSQHGKHKLYMPERKSRLVFNMEYIKKQRDFITNKVMVNTYLIGEEGFKLIDFINTFEKFSCCLLFQSREICEISVWRITFYRLVMETASLDVFSSNTESRVVLLIFFLWINTLCHINAINDGIAEQAHVAETFCPITHVYLCVFQFPVGWLAPYKMLRPLLFLSALTALSGKRTGFSNVL